MSKKLAKLLCLALTATVMAGCGTATSSNGDSNVTPTSETSEPASHDYGETSDLISSDATPSSSSKSTSSEEGPTWDTATKRAMRTYCGEVLPYVELKSGFTMNETEDDNEVPYLEIYDESTTFTIADYYKKLEAAGWTMEKENGSVVLEDDDGNTFYSAIKTANGGADLYNVLYYFYDGYGNCIDCHHYVMGTELTSDTDWNADAKEAMMASLRDVLPFMKMGNGYQCAYEGTQFQLTDDYKDDLSAAYGEVLTKNGYTYVGLDEYGDALYDKVFADGSKITANPYYVFGTGNVIYAYFTPKMTTVTTWPSELFTEIETKVGYTIPSYQASSYTYYILDDAITVFTETTVSKEDAYGEALETAGFVVSENIAYTFEETLAIEFADDGEYNEDFDWEVSAFSVTVYETEPESTYTDEFPSTEVSAYIKDVCGVDVNVIAANDKNTPHKKIKSYVIELNNELIESIYEEEYAFWVALGFYTEDEAYEMAEQEAAGYAGFYVSVYDPTGASFDELKAAVLNDANLYAEYDEQTGGYLVESADGKYAYFFASSSNCLSIQYFKGTGTAHEREFALNKTTLKLKPGSTFQLELTTKMVPSSSVVTWESTNTAVATVENGLITVANNITEGTTTIKASTTVEGSKLEAECAVTVSTTSQTVTITPADVPTKYDETFTKRTIQGLELTVRDVMNQTNKVQIKKNTGCIYNAAALNPITSITFNGANKSDNMTLSAGTAADSLTAVDAEVTGSTVTYNLDGATFFKFENGKGVFTCDSITFEF